ncbi:MULTISPECIES: bifunctional hydroxymethylpyrimidine kinase/phosphomethylpyrimidine kinase [unclassified Paracoccus (in: a-proteobacteria)]|uniref:bifunctional hydroxymethylpyrimidine kinase/phosphomethylpyrimidine kinase n=1 Tax=unclassified Paracoccus (in: a-proteobacteria) TaxID=2688777 RepID=UPI0012B25E7A|nr:MULTISPECIES: bifunctional hydroxymethylpyrimidine kinase/phosphomethylpyrimidine kinase [unclassified Paracoccus (in: a-proteobacteria)]UXU75710.1 bifunctional hydroxymethylpyrimidine kinase/phosphomethylpyrimidine kinase [Paracoccus sp. SMMA_5]UXU81616.1 bifunctional hydroxymethylpyrimidine kinase/phosphomethylpyrimidine kinase [Paracoccus sp. SMMA_5_TC]
MRHPIALTIAGSDSGGGAGIQADLKSFSALGVYGASVITAITAQNTRTVAAVAAVSPAMVAAQIDAVLGDLEVRAIKIGMLGGEEVIAAVADRLRVLLQANPVPVVLDPVMVAKSGDPLLADQAVATLRERLLPLATLLTPNLPEAARLLGRPVAETPEEMAAQGEALRDLGPAHVLMKGGHAPGRLCTDLLVGPQPLSLTAPRQQTRNTHGTGCSLSSAIAAGMAQGLGVAQAVAQAHRWLQGAIAAADDLAVGLGHGPVHHFHALWGR